MSWTIIPNSLPISIRLYVGKLCHCSFKTSFDDINVLRNNALRHASRQTAFTTLRIELGRVVDFPSWWPANFHKYSLLINHQCKFGHSNYGLYTPNDITISVGRLFEDMNLSNIQCVLAYRTPSFTDSNMPGVVMAVMRCFKTDVAYWNTKDPFATCLTIKMCISRHRKHTLNK